MAILASFTHLLIAIVLAGPTMSRKISAMPSNQYVRQPHDLDLAGEESRAVLRCPEQCDIRDFGERAPFKRVCFGPKFIDEVRRICLSQNIVVVPVIQQTLQDDFFSSIRQWNNKQPSNLLTLSTFGKRFAGVFQYLDIRRMIPSNELVIVENAKMRAAPIVFFEDSRKTRI
jgi:hypothetical protein